MILIPKNREQGQQNANNFRPITINSIFGKIFEKLLYYRLYHYFETHDLFPENQFGFTYGKSAIGALYKLKQDMVEALQNNENVIVISLDITNAFGNIKFERVRQRFIELGIPKEIRELIFNILENRTIIYELENGNIELKLSKGAPQGSPLSPFLWNVIVSELLEMEMPECVSVQAFADDLTILVTGRSRIILEQEAAKALDIIHDWSIRNELTFSHEKCEFINLGNAYRNRPPIITMNGNSIKRVQQTKILGVIFDNKLSFIPHLKAVKQKVQKITTALGKFTGTDWGMTPKHFRQIYFGSIERMIVYGSQIYFPPICKRNKMNTEKVKRLKAIQRIPLSKIAKSFHTVSNASLNIICDIPPIHITIERENRIFNILNAEEKFVFENKEYGKDEIATKIQSSRIHPAKKRKYEYVKTIGKADYRFYTDGPQQENKCGAAYVIMDSGGNAIRYKQMKLPDYFNNFEAETVAILEAIKEISRMEQHNKYQIVTDSLSTLEALKNSNNTNPFIHKIRLLLNQLVEFKIKLVYTKAHKGTAGNELADQLAKEAIKEGTYYDIPTSKTFIKKELRRQSSEQWNKY